MKLVEENIYLPDLSIIAYEILEWSGTLYSYLEDAIGATDGIHISVKVPAEDIPCLNRLTF